jgi:pyridoxal phosphate enzyme (YggS family)
LCPTSEPPGDARAAEVGAALQAVRRRLDEACAAVARDPATVTLIAVTKTFPAGDVAVLADLGVRDIGESRDQEARAKRGEVAALLGDAAADLRWHFVGQVQSRKARSVAGYAAAVHSLDRAALVPLLADARGADRPPLEVFVQVSLDGDPARGGALAADVPAIADAAAARPHLRLRGVMAVPPLGADPDACFARLAEISATLREQHPGADAISAGMSDDLEAAVRHGSTHVRIGSALLGRRPPPVG